MKEWEEEDKEADFPVQMSVKEVNFEDERFKEQAAPPLDEEFPIGTMVFFLGEHAYGVVAQVHDNSGDALSVTLAVCFIVFLSSLKELKLYLVLPWRKGRKGATRQISGFGPGS